MSLLRGPLSTHFDGGKTRCKRKAPFRSGDKGTDISFDTQVSTGQGTIFDK